MKRIIVASNIRKNEYDPQSVKKAVYALFDAAFASSLAREKLGTNNISYTFTSIQVIKRTRPLRYHLEINFDAESPDFKHNGLFDNDVLIFDVPIGREANEDEFINQENIKRIVTELRGNVTNFQIENIIQSNIDNFKSAIDAINLEYPEIQLKYRDAFIADNEATFLYVQLLGLGGHKIYKDKIAGYGYGYLDGDESLSIRYLFHADKYDKRTPMHTEIVSVETYVELLRNYADDYLEYLEVFDKCCKICDNFERSLSSMISAVASKFSVSSEDCSVKTYAALGYKPRVAVEFLGRTYRVTDGAGNQIMSPSDIVKKAINALRYQERKAKNPTKPSSGSSHSQELL